jgi:hypothetical protein
VVDSRAVLVSRIKIIPCYVQRPRYPLDTAAQDSFFRSYGNYIKNLKGVSIQDLESVVNPVLAIRCSRRVQNALFYPFMVFTVGCHVTGLLA